MFRSQLYITILFLAVTGAGCAVIAGKEEPEVPGQEGKQFRLTYVETLRNQASLRGESFRDVVLSTSTPTTLQLPNSVYADMFRVYVTDQAKPARVFIFDRSDRTVRVLAVPLPPADGKLLDPSGIAADSGNMIYVADAPQGKVFVYDLNGTLILTYGKWGDLAHPMGIAVDKAGGRVYVADSHSKFVKVFTFLGDHQFDIGGDGPADKRLRSPIGLALGRDGRIYVLDGQSKHVHVYSLDGKLMKRFPLSKGLPGDTVKPRGIAVDSAGHIYVADSVNNNILIFGPDGSYLKTWGKTGIVSGDFWTPQGLFIDERDQIYIADQTNARIQVYQFQK